MKINLPECPTLRPTIKQFECFSDYVQKVEKNYRDSYGMVKIVPPAQWVSRSKNYKKIIKKLTINKPQYQTLYGDQRNFYFQCQNAYCKSLSIQEYQKLAEKKASEIKHLTNKQTIQKYFWNIFSGLRNQLYCANIEVTLMDSKSGQWQFQKLNSFFNEAVKEKLLGLNTSFLFIGSWRTFFNWHIEDLDLSAINLVHQGATKMWYGIHPQDRKKYESILKDLYPEENRNCSNFYRHKQIYLNPYKLKEKYPYLRISKMYQNQGQISLAFANGYHCGFNMGYNVAEAVNYGTRDWLDRFTNFKRCKCPAQIGVQIEYQDIVNNLKKSSLYKSIKNTQAFNIILERANQEIKADQLYDNADSHQISMQIEKEKSKRKNTGRQLIYVPKYKRYFPIQNKLIYQIECQSCGKWRKIDEKTNTIYSKKRFECKMMKLKCKFAKRKKDKKQSKILKTKMIRK